MKSRIKIVQYTFITYRLGRAGLSQAVVARIIGCTPEMLNQVIKGTKVSGNIQSKLAFILGYPSWQKLLDAAVAWDWYFAQDCKKERKDV